MNFASFARLGLILCAVAVTAQDLPSNKTVDLSTTTQNSPRIYGGTAVDATKYPYVVQLTIDVEDGKVLCGGTLIASQFVVTAAQCVSEKPTSITATMGSVVRTVRSYKIHPDYDDDTLDNDIAVLKLRSTVDIKTVRLAKANESDNKVGTAAVVFGWGETESGKPSSGLKKVSLRLISNSDCRKANDDQIAITSGMLCAWGGEGKDSCQGDGGGPLFANGILVGIVSFGWECGETPGVYVRVASYRDFIKSVINGGSSRSFTNITAQSTNTYEAAVTKVKTKTATTATTGGSTIHTRELAGGVVVVIILALCAVVSVAGFMIYKRFQNRKEDAADVYHKQLHTPATPSTTV
ncbi:hypothetical protein DVH05_010094 [Phytophthora capsici]|nr:hypothetical protein DVH05_010094 [Phytophthora capsici]